MGNNSPRFIEKSFVPTFGEEFSNIATPEFDSEIWTTELVDALIDKVEHYGLDLNKAKNPFFDKNPTLRKGRVAFQMTLQEKDEFKRCRKDIIYFANKYVQLMTPEGIGHITLYPYQEQMLLNYKNGKNNIVVGSRQIGKTVVAGIFLTWFLIFHPDKNIMLAANKGDTAKEILDKVKSIISFLPFWLKPGLFSWNMFSIMTDANSRILATTTTDKAAIGFTIHLLFLDEFAHVRESIQRSFWDNIYPVMAADPKSKMIMTSTPNGYELFQELYHNASELPEGKSNGFTHMKIPWWDVPGRDDSWADQQKAILGEDAFNEQFACAFQRSDLLLLSAKELNSMKGNIEPFVHHEFEHLDKYNILYENLLFREDYDIENLKKDSLFFSIDLAEGVGRDYTVMQIFKLAPKIERDIKVSNNEVFQLEKHFYLDQIGIFRDNLISIEDFAKLTYNLLFSGKFVNIDNIKVVLEWNTYGSFFDEKLKHLYGGDLYDDSVYLKTYHRKGAKRKRIGLRQDKVTKPRNCAEVKNLISNQIMILHDKWTIQEFNHFNRNKKGSYEASTGHDDTVMTCVNTVEVFRDSLYVDMVAECFETQESDTKIHINSLMKTGNSLDSSTDFLAENFNTKGMTDDDFSVGTDWF